MLRLALALFGLVIVAVAVAVTLALHAGARRMADVEARAQRPPVRSTPLPPFDLLFTPIDELLQRPPRTSQEPDPFGPSEDTSENPEN